MGNFHPPFAKAVIKKALRAIVDPEIKSKDKDAIWAWFDSCCAYCGTRMERNSRKAHIDHMAGNSNHISNMVLSCGPCNGDQKREKDWKAFLLEICGGKTPQNEQRLQKIEAWVAQQPGYSLPAEQLQMLNEEIAKVYAVFDNAVDTLRKSRPKGKAEFTQQESKAIIALIRQKVVATTNKQKTLSAKIRKIGFHAEDLGLGGGYTEHDFLRVVKIGS